MAATAALPAYIPLRDEAAPMKLDGIVEEGEADAAPVLRSVAVKVEEVPTAVGPAVLVELWAP